MPVHTSSSQSSDLLRAFLHGPTWEEGRFEDFASVAPAAAGSFDQRDMAVQELLRMAREAVAQEPRKAEALIGQAQSLLLPSQHSLEQRVDDAGGLVFWQLRRALDHIRANMHRPIRVDDLARICGLSPSYFSKAFKRSLGSTPGSYINGMRCRLAQRLMATSDAPLSQIAISCGFYDQAHLCKIFRALTGQTPNAWRRQLSATPANLRPPA